MLISIFISALALMSSRNISLFGLISLIIICANMAPALSLRESNRVRLNIWQRWFSSPVDRTHSYILIFLFILIISAFLYLLSDARGNNSLIKNSFGLGLYGGNSDSMKFFKDNNLSGPIFNNYDIGSALIFWLRPQEAVFVDNRPEAYSNAFFSEIYKPMQADPEQWDKYLQEYDFKTIYFTHTDGTPWAQEFLARIFNDGKWKLAYLDSYAVILINAEKYSALEVNALSLDKWAIKKRIRESAAGAPLKYRLHLANLAQAAGVPEAAEEIYREIIFNHPDQGQALYALAVFYAGYGDRDRHIKAIDYFQRALESGFRLPGIYNQLGLSYWKLGRYKEAEDAWRSALKRERKNSHALYYLDQVEELKKAGELPAESSD